MPHLTRRALTLIRLPWAVKCALPEASLAAVVVESLIERVPLPKLCAILGVTLNREHGQQPNAHKIGAEGSLLFQALLIAYRNLGLRPTCLKLALCFGFLVRMEGPVLYVGCATGGDAFLAHAWLTWGARCFSWGADDNVGYSSLGTNG